MKTIKTIFSMIILSIFLCAVPAQADEIEDKTWQQNEIVQFINAKQLELDQLSNEYTEALLSQEQLTRDIEQNEKDIKKIEKKIKKQKAKLSEQCNITYKVDDSSLLDIILSSNDFTSLISNINFCQRFINKTSILLDETKSLNVELKEKKVQQEQKKKELEVRFQEIEESKNAADACIADLQNQYNNLNEEIATLIIEQQIIKEQEQNTQEEVENLSLEDTTDLDEVSNDNNIIEEISESETEEVKAKIEAGESIEGYDNDVVARAYAMLGTPYSWGGTTSEGFDCSGFVSYCLTGEEGTRLGTTETFVGWTQVSNPQPGDVCVVHNDSSQHTGVYVGDGKMVHAATYGVGVVEGDVQDGMIYVRYTG